MNYTNQEIELQLLGIIFSLQIIKLSLLPLRTIVKIVIYFHLMQIVGTCHLKLPKLIIFRAKGPDFTIV